eukprot:364111-Chlamydomonas_euryale.AAC.2
MEEGRECGRQTEHCYLVTASLQSHARLLPFGAYAALFPDKAATTGQSSTPCLPLDFSWCFSPPPAQLGIAACTKFKPPNIPVTSHTPNGRPCASGRC